MNSDNEDMQAIEYLSQFGFSAKAFTYKGRNVPYSQIQRIEYYSVATKHSVNFVPTGTTFETKLIVHIDDGEALRIKQEPSFLRIRQKEKSEAIQKAAAALQFLSFEHRIKRYEALMETKGFVTWGRYQIHKDGSLFKDFSYILNFLGDDVSMMLSNFSVTFKRKNPSIKERLIKAWSGDETIDLTVDKDCFLYICKTRFNRIWKDTPVPERRINQKEQFTRAIIILGARLCKIDGHVSSDEIVRFKTYFGIDEKSFPGASELFRSAISSSENTDNVASDIRKLFSSNEPLEYIILGLVHIAEDRGYIHQAEFAYIRMVAAAFGFSDIDLARISPAFSGDRQGGTGDGYAATLARCLHILGVTSETTVAEIKVAYRALARRHHPDILRASGVPYDQIKGAEEILKSINDAYAWVMKHDKRMAQ